MFWQILKKTIDLRKQYKQEIYLLIQLCKLKIYRMFKKGIGAQNIGADRHASAPRGTDIKQAGERAALPT